MDTNYTCPKCRQRNLRITKGKNKLRCTTMYCYYVSDVMTKEEINEFLNYVPEPPAKLELCMEEIQRSAYDCDSAGNIEINLSTLEDILEEYIKN